MWIESNSVKKFKNIIMNFFALLSVNNSRFFFLEIFVRHKKDNL